MGIYDDLAKLPKSFDPKQALLVWLSTGVLDLAVDVFTDTAEEIAIEEIKNRLNLGEGSIENGGNFITGSQADELLSLLKSSLGRDIQPKTNDYVDPLQNAIP